ncbi:hypothetical protein M0802_004717 [Mischocyttarus mexicanus]|nr:hypothetical protein M0802_004717 [Mischocyttarus mexicanus]
MTLIWSGKVFSMILIVIISFHVKPNNCLGDLTFGDVGDILRFGQETIQELLKVLEIIDNVPGNEDNIPFISRKEKMLKNRIREVSSKLDYYQERTEAKTEKVFEQLMINLPMKLSMENDFREFDHYIGQINDLYDVFVKYANSPEAYERFTLENFAKASVSPDLGALPDVLKTLHRLIVPNQSQLFNRSIIVSFSNQMKVRLTNYCKSWIPCCKTKEEEEEGKDKMILFKSLVCLVFLLGLWTIKSDSKKDITVVDELRQELLELEVTLRKELNYPKWSLAKDTDVYLHIIKYYNRFCNRIEELFPNNRPTYLDSLNPLWIWAKTEEEIAGINGLYMIFRQMQHEIVEQNSTINIAQLSNFAQIILKDPNASIPKALQRIADYIVNQKLFVSAYQESLSQFCSDQQSPQQLLFNLYNTIAITEIKGYTMIQFSYMLLRLYISGSNFNEEMESLKQQYAVRTSETLRAVKTAMAFAPQDFWKCDPFKHEPGKTYMELNQLFQGYIVNEVDLNSVSTCRENCGYYGYTKVHGCFDNHICAEQRTCSGKLVNCEYIDSDMWICPSKDSSRRYDYIEYENGKIFGQKRTCQKSLTKVDSWWRWLFWHCSYCFCYCDDHNSSSDRYFNLRSVIADINNNKVITGIKLTKFNKIIHIQIQEGELLPQGGINSTTVAWKPVDNYTVYDDNVNNGIDYHTIVWEKRAIDLDDLKSPKDHLLTGIKLRMIGTRLNLEIMVTPFNFTTGKLIQPSAKSYWISNDNTDRKELKLQKPDIPIRMELQHMSDTGVNQYLNFGPSDREKDAAQSTIPFLDIQPVEPKPPIPLAGAGIFHKGRSGSGGFLTLKLLTYNFAPHLYTDLPPSPPVIEKYNEITAV